MTCPEPPWGEKGEGMQEKKDTIQKEEEGMGFSN
jgi:hypothetical protein